MIKKEIGITMKVMRCCITSRHQFGWTSIRTNSTGTTKNTEQSHYNTLGVTQNCPKTRIKVAYYKLSKKYHPDVNKTEEAKVKFQEISEAYDVLSNPVTRHEYDKSQASFSPGYRTKVRHGQEKYKPKGVIYPTGRSSTYNFDEWHVQHYQSIMETNWRQKQSKELGMQEMNAYNRERDKFRTADSGKLSTKIILFVMSLFGLGSAYYYLSLKLRKVGKTVGTRKNS